MYVVDFDRVIRKSPDGDLVVGVAVDGRSTAVFNITTGKPADAEKQETAVLRGMFAKLLDRGGWFHFRPPATRDDVTTAVSGWNI